MGDGIASTGDVGEADEVEVGEGDPGGPTATAPADGTDPEPQRHGFAGMRFAFAVAALLTLGGFLVLVSAGQTVQSMEQEGCPTGRPDVLQVHAWSGSTDHLREVVTGWHLFTVVSSGSSDDRFAGGGPVICRSITAASTTQNPDLATGYSAIDVVKTWLLIDSAFFVVAYAVLLGIGCGSIRRGAWDEGSALGPVLWSLRRWLEQKPAVFWGLIVLIIAGAVADIAENILLRRRLDRWWGRLDEAGSLANADLDLGAVRLAGTLKWLFLLAPAALVGVLLFSILVSSLVDVVLMLRRAWASGLIAIVFVVAVTVPAQSADVLRRLSATQWLMTIVLVLILAAVLTATSAGLADQATSEAADAPRSWHALPLAGLGLVLLVLPWLTSIPLGVRVPGAILLVVGLLSLALDRAKGAMPARSDAREIAAVLGGDERGARQRIGPWIGAGVVVALGTSAIRASAGDLIILGAGAEGNRLWRVVMGVVLVVSGVGVYWVLRCLFGAVVPRPSWAARLTWVAFATTAVTGALFTDPDVSLGHASDVGTVGLVAIFLTCLATVPAVASWTASRAMERTWLRPFVLPSLLRALGFRTPPVAGFLVLWLLSGRLVAYDAYHDLRTTAGLVDPDGVRAGTIAPSDVVDAWNERQGEGAGSRPALIVAASGGGVRAAYWTALVLTCVIERDRDGSDPCGAPSERVAQRRASVLAMSGISGGSLGLASYVAAAGDEWGAESEPPPLDPMWATDRFDGDFLAPTVATWMFSDGLNTLLRRPAGVDRAAVLERAWEQQWDDGTLEAPFLEGQITGDLPLLMLNGFDAEKGCRVNVSVLSSAADPAESAIDPDRCAQASGVDRTLLATADAMDALCHGEDLRISTAALASARFPFVTPAGRLTDACTQNVDGSAQPDLEIVDGGYRETSAASTLVELWPALDEALESGGQRCVAPVFLQIDNGYTSNSPTSSGGSVLDQFTAPLNAVISAPAGVEGAARQQSETLFGRNHVQITTHAHPGSSAPLGWVLSEEAMNDLRTQLRLQGPWIDLVRHLLDDPPEPCAPGG